MIKKTLISDIKALDESQGLVEAFTNTMGIKDSDGDVLDPAAFNTSIAKNLPIPVLSGHDQHTVVGKVLSARPVHIQDDEHRLYTLMQMNMKTQAGRETFSNVEGNYMREWSVGFNVPEGGWELEGRGQSQVRRIKDLDWVEVSAVVRGASPATQTISAKAQETIEIPETGADDISNEIDNQIDASDTAVNTASDTSYLKAKLSLIRTQLELKMPKRKKPKKY